MSGKTKYFAALMLLTLAIRVEAGELLHSEDFEDGVANGYVLQNASVTSANGYNSQRALRGTHVGTVIAYTTVPSGHRELTVRYKWYTSPTWIAGNGVKYARLRGPSQIIQFEFGWTSGAEPMGSHLVAYGTEPDRQNTDYGEWTGAGIDFGFSGSASPLNRGQWMDIEIHSILNDPGFTHNGTMEVWVGGVKVANHIGDAQLRYESTSFYTLVYVISNIGTSNANCWNDVDDIEIWSGTPGGQPTPTPTPTPTPPPPTPSPTPTPTPSAYHPVLFGGGMSRIAN